MALVEYECRNGVGFITLNRPEVLNALSDDSVRALRAALLQLDDDDDAQVGVLSGRGRAFCSGGDVKKRQLKPIEEMRRLGGGQERDARVEDLMYRFTNYKPVIAAVHGYAVGAGFYISFMCDLLVAAEGTQFQVTETPRGLDPTHFWHLIRQRMNGGFATDVVMTGRFWTAEEAFPKGGVDRVVPEGQHLAAAEKLARTELLTNAPLAVRALVEARRGVLEEIELMARLRRPRNLHLTEDFRESAMAYVEKRNPVFRGR